jgi:hypothetical protein
VSTAARYYRLTLLYDASAPIPGRGRPMTPSEFVRFGRAILAETLDNPAAEDIRELCRRLVYDVPEAPRD